MTPPIKNKKVKRKYPSLVKKSGQQASLPARSFIRRKMNQAYRSLSWPSFSTASMDTETFMQNFPQTVSPGDKKEGSTTRDLLGRLKEKEFFKLEKEAMLKTSDCFPPPTFSSLYSSPLESQKAKSLHAFKQKLAQMCEENNYTFAIRRSRQDTLYIQFTAMNSVLASVEKIRAELVILAELLQQVLVHSSISIPPKQMQPNWKEWNLTLSAPPALLNQLESLLQTEGFVKNSEFVTTCLMQ